MNATHLSEKWWRRVESERCWIEMERDALQMERRRAEMEHRWLEAEHDALRIQLHEAELQTQALNHALRERQEEMRFRSVVAEEERRGSRAREQQLETQVQALRDLLQVQAVEVQAARERLSFRPLTVLVPEFRLSVPTRVVSPSVGCSHPGLVREQPCSAPLRTNISARGCHSTYPRSADGTLTRAGRPSERVATRKPLYMPALAEARAAFEDGHSSQDVDTAHGEGATESDTAPHLNSKLPWSWLQIAEVSASGRFVQVLNSSAQHSEELGGCLLQQLHAGAPGEPSGTPIAIYRFPYALRVPPGLIVTVWAGASGVSACPPTDLLWAEWPRLKTGSHITTVLCRPNGQLITWHCTQHRTASCVAGRGSRGFGTSREETPVASSLGVNGIG